MKQILLFLFICGSVLCAGQKPNFVVILTDDQGYADLSCFGGTHVKTPRIDQMAAEGAKLTSFYMAAPVCTPSRAALLTGSYPKRVGMGAGVLFPWSETGLNPDEITIAEVLKSNGYKTGMFGKWHLGHHPEFMPTRQGFDEFYGIPYSHDIHPFNPLQDQRNFPPLPLMEGEQCIETDPDADYFTRQFTERALRFIAENKEHPFFLYLPHPAPHKPLHASPPFMESVSTEIKAELALENNTIDYKTRDEIYPQVISEIDWSVGQVLDALKEHGIDENTLVIFTSDNGPASSGMATPLRGRKGRTFEGGMRVPAVIRWPGEIPVGSVNDEMMTAMDLLPTFAKLAGAETPTDRVIDGQDIWPVLTQGETSPHEAFFYHSKYGKLEAVRSGKWKLRVESQHRGQKTKMMLCDLETDIEERTDVSTEHPEVVERLRGLIADFEKELEGAIRPAGFIENSSSNETAPSRSSVPAKLPSDMQDGTSHGLRSAKNLLLNASFGDGAPTKANAGFDSAGTFDVPNWNDSPGGSYGKSFESNGINNKAGEWFAFLKKGNAGAEQLSEYTLKKGETLQFSFDYQAANATSSGQQVLLVEVFYDDNGTQNNLLSETFDMVSSGWITDKSLQIEADKFPAAIDKKIGVRIGVNPKSAVPNNAFVRVSNLCLVTTNSTPAQSK